MKILWVKGGGLVPPDTGGRIRTYNLLRELTRAHHITFFSFHDINEDAPHQQLTDMFENVVSVPLTLPTPKSARESLDYLRSLFTSQPYSVYKFCRPRVRHELTKVIAEWSVDILICDFLLPAPIIPWDCKIPKVIFAHNVEAMIWKRHYEVAQNPLWKMASWREWKSMERIEREYQRRADHVIAVSDADRDVFAQWLPPDRLSVISTGVDIGYFRPSGEQPIPDSLIFTGSMDWLPNEDSMTHFLENILPLVRAQVPTVTVQIVGRRPSRKLQSLVSRQSGVTLTGRVEDVRPYLARAALSIVPLRIGGGTRLKIFEAMAMAKPVVSTALGAEGLPVQNGLNILLGDGPADFAASVVDLLKNPSKAHAIGVSARRLVEENFAWPRVAAQFSEIMQRVLEQTKSKYAS